MNFSKNQIVTLLCILFCLSAYSQKDSLTMLERIKNLETYKENVELSYNNNAAKLEKHIDDKVEEKVKDIEETKKILNWILFLGLPATILGLFGVYWGAVKKAKKLIFDKIENIVEHKREDLIKLIETQEYDTKLRNTKKLLVISPDQSANDKIKNIISALQFKNVSYRTTTTYTEYPDYDLIIFNDLDGSVPQAFVDEYLDNTQEEKVSFITLTTKTFSRNPRINFSNNQVTLYHNILLSLKYTEVLKVI